MTAIKLLLVLLLIPSADTTLIGTELRKAAFYNSENNPDSSFVAASKALELAVEINDLKSQAAAEYQLGKSYMLQSDFTSSMQHILTSEELYKAIGDSVGIGQSNLQLGLIEYTQKNFLDALPYFNIAYSIGDKTQNKKLISTCCYLIGRIYLETNELRKAELLLNMAIRVKKEMGNSQGYYECLSALAELHYKRGEFQKSKNLYSECLKYFVQSENPNGMAVCHYGLANAFSKSNQSDSALSHYTSSYQLSRENNYRVGILNASKSLSEFYRSERQYSKALDYLEQYHELHDSIFNIDNARKLAKLQFQLSLAQKQIEINDLSRQKEKDKNLQYLMAVVILILITFIVTVYYFYRSEQKSKKELKAANKKLEQTLLDLKNAEEQLIRSEKLASLGQLTASVAHELKNPLNFIINFSESSSEIIEELSQEKPGRNNEEFKELKKNLERIQAHGKRANSIITNMMMHARNAAKEKSLTNLSTLLHETTDLAYQAMRASKPSFHCKIINNLQHDSVFVNIIEQEVGRVILNLLNNAFYATSLRIGTENYNPEIKISLSVKGKNAVITIEDNGIGMDKETLSRIFEPFYTTKPTGEGTGLGLSMSYDMIHSNGGTIEVTSEPMKFTLFTIILPLAETNKFS